jgi:hypothetical protein
MEKEFRSSQDSAWKDIIKAHFHSFLSFYFPAIAALVDPAAPPEFLDKELDRLIPHSRTKGRYADLLAKTHTLSGSPVLLFAHIEVQGRKETDFEKRIFTYAYRIYDALGELPVNLLVLTDRDPAFLPQAFEITSLGRYLRLEFQVAKLLYWEGKQQDLEGSNNIFAFVTLAQLKVNRKKHPAYALKKELILMLLRRGYRKSEIRSLLRFLDWLVALPEGLDKQLTEEIEKETGGGPMAYVTSWERIAKKEGMQEGVLKGKLEEKREVLARMLDKKFHLSPADLKKIEACSDTDKLDRALDAVLFAVDRQEVLRELG